MAKQKKQKNALVAVRAKRNAAPRENPPLGFDAVNVLLPGIGAYAATRTVARMVHSMVARRSARWSKHAHVAASVAAFGGVWLVGHKVQRLAKYHDAIVMGAGLAAFQTLAAAYLPEKYRWLIADPQRTWRPALPVVTGRVMPASAASAAPIVAQITEDYDSEYAQLDAQLRELEQMGETRNRRSNSSDDGDDREPPVTVPPKLQEDLAADDLSDLYSGAFDNVIPFPSA